MKLAVFKRVGFGYPEQALVLNGVNLTLNRGERALVLGANGTGKSTLALLAAGSLVPSQGEIWVAGQLRRGIVLQHSNEQMIGSTVAEDLAFGLAMLNLPPEEIKEQVDHYLKIFGLEAKRDYGIQQLSGGELRRLALAGALIIQPDILILDEPLGMLDQGNQQVFLNCLNNLLSPQAAVLWFDHDLRSVRYTSSWYVLAGVDGLQRVGLEELNQPEFIKHHHLQAAPLQRLEWEHPGRINKAIFGPEMMEWHDV